MEERAVPEGKMAESGPTAGSSDTAETYKAFPVNNCRERAGVTSPRPAFTLLGNEGKRGRAGGLEGKISLG